MRQHKYPGTICGFNLGLAQPQLSCAQGDSKPGSVLPQAAKVTLQPLTLTCPHRSPPTSVFRVSPHNFLAGDHRHQPSLPHSQFSHLNGAVADFLGLVWQSDEVPTGECFVYCEVL